MHADLGHREGVERLIHQRQGLLAAALSVQRIGKHDVRIDAEERVPVRRRVIRLHQRHSGRKVALVAPDQAQLERRERMLQGKVVFPGHAHLALGQGEAGIELIGKLQGNAADTERKGQRGRVWQRIGEGDRGGDAGCDLLRQAGQREPDRLDAVRADARIVAGKHVRETMVTQRVVAAYTVLRLLDHLRRVTREVRVSPAMVQAFEAEVVIRKPVPDFQELVAECPRDVEPA